MATALRVLLSYKLGKVWLDASAEAQHGAGARWSALRNQWKTDPAIRFITSYNRPSVDHCLLFEVDDIDKADEMQGAFYRANFLVEWYKIEYVTADPESEEFWS